MQQSPGEGGRPAPAPAILSLQPGRAAAEFYRRGLWQHSTIYQLAAAHAAIRPCAAAVRSRTHRLTWHALLMAVDRLAAQFAALGLKPGQRVSWWMPDRVEAVVLLLACSRAGLVCSPSPHRNHTVRDVVGMVAQMRAQVLFHQTGYGADADQADLAAAMAELAAPCRLVGLAAAELSHQVGAPFADIIGDTGGEGSLPAPICDPDRVSYLAFTSGSTGRPKAVMHSDNTLLVAARAISRDWNIGAGDVVCSMSPFCHNLGIGALLTALVAGAEFVIHDLPRGHSVLDRLVETDTSYLVGVPTHALDLVGEMRRRGIRNPGRLRAMRISGAASPPHLMHDLLAYGIEPQSGYGMTENNAHQYTRPGDPAELIAGSVGHACEGYEIGIFDPDNPDIARPVGTEGIVAGRGACLMLGYFNDQLATEDSFNAHGWFLTGDLGRLDNHGYLTITGRRKEVIIRGGHNAYPARIEGLAMQAPEVARAAVVPVADARLGERICLVITCRPDYRGERPPMGVLSHLIKAGLSRYEMPEFLLELDPMPLMTNGKIDKPLIMSWIRDASVTPVEVKRPRGD